jgi:LmbE family N-acetylglucosaminyl deacetylase
LSQNQGVCNSDGITRISAVCVLVKSILKSFWVDLHYHLFIRTLAIMPVENLFRLNERVLIVAPHPDDEVIGLAGVMLNSLDRGCMVSVLFLTDGEASGADSDIERIRSKRVELRKHVLSSMGIPLQQQFALNLPDAGITRFDDPSFGDVSVKIRHIIEQLDPTKLFVTHPADYWPFDHVHAAQVVTDAWAAAGKPCELYYYWVWAWYHMRPSRWKQLNFSRLFKVDIEQYRKRKNELIDLYLEPKAPSGIPWSGKLPMAMLAPLRKRYEILERVDV